MLSWLSANRVSCAGSDVAGASPALAGLAVATLTAAGLVGDILVVGIVARVSGLRYLRFSSFAAGLVSPAFLLVPGPGLKLQAACCRSAWVLSLAQPASDPSSGRCSWRRWR